MNLFSKTADFRLIEYINRKSLVKRIIQFAIGCFIISIAYNTFIVPNSLVPGGVGGIAIIINNFFGIENSTSIFFLNIILLTLSYFLLGKEKTRASILGSILFPLFIKLTANSQKLAN